ncbi:hypothetical protein GCM10010255_26540 [Streptomyces coeruleofuscus]|uniref:Uncharacterized protein n=1 Tax=Streptomyces coeruleofuscus TaxID=66879 RepID=A0ABP5V5D9_9ACTN
MRWQERHGIEMEPEALSVFESNLTLATASCGSSERLWSGIFRGEFDEGLLPAPFSAQTSGPVLLGDVKYQVRRASAVLRVGADQPAAIPDFRMALS